MSTQTTTTGADPAAASAAAGTAAAAGTTNVAQQQAPVTWTDTIQDADLREWSVNKGYNKHELSAAAPIIAQQYRSLEKLVGAEKAGRTVELPDWEATDQTQLDAFYDRIGRPKDTKDYDLALPEKGVHPEFENWARTNFHKAGLSAKQANLMGKAWSEFAGAQNAKETADAKLAFEKEDGALKTEWGSAYDNKMALASAAAKQFGVPGEAIDALQKAGGYAVAMKTFAAIATKLGEANFITGDKPGGDGMMTPAEATAEIKTLRANKDWVASFLDKGHPKHKEAVARMTFLSEKQVSGQQA